jgi:hypothetical protein
MIHATWSTMYTSALKGIASCVDDIRWNSSCANSFVVGPLPIPDSETCSSACWIGVFGKYRCKDPREIRQMAVPVSGQKTAGKSGVSREYKRPRVSDLVLYSVPGSGSVVGLGLAAGSGSLTDPRAGLAAVVSKGNMESVMESVTLLNNTWAGLDLGWVESKGWGKSSTPEEVKISRSLLKIVLVVAMEAALIILGGGSPPPSDRETRFPT